MSVDDIRNITVECLPGSPYKIALYYIREQAIWWDTYHRNIGEPQAKSFCASFEALLGLANDNKRSLDYAEGYKDGESDGRASVLSEVRSGLNELEAKE